MFEFLGLKKKPQPLEPMVNEADMLALKQVVSDQMVMIAEQADFIEGWRSIQKAGEDSPTTYGPNVPIPSHQLANYGGDFARVYDRSDGRYMPYYETEMHVLEILAMSRQLDFATSLPGNAINILDGYVIGDGYTYTVKAIDETKEDSLAPQIRILQQLVDRIIDKNELHAVYDSEIHTKTRIDGERLVAIRDDGEIPSWEMIEPQCLREPLNAKEINRQYQVEDNAVDWTFGVASAVDRTTGRNCVEKPLAYHVIYDDGGVKWDVIGADKAVHFMLNVPSTAKRGVSDIYCNYADLDSEGKLHRNSMMSLNIMSCIAYVKELNEAVRNQSSVDGKNTTQVARSGIGGGSISQSVTRMSPGTIATLQNAIYKAGPLAEMTNDAVENALAYAVKRIGLFWSMPAFMLLGDTESALYNSVLAIGSPFVNKCQQKQQYFGRKYVELIKKTAAIMIDDGRVHGLNSSKDVFRNLEITFTAPDVALTDDVQKSTRVIGDMNAGLISKQTAREELNYDHEQELERLSSESGAEYDMSEFRDNPEAYTERVAKAWEGYLHG